MIERKFHVFSVRCFDKWLSWEEVKFYAAMFDLPTVPELGLESVAGLPQDQFHHVEGDVATHTLRVIEELQKLPGYLALTEQDKEILWTAALLHDVEKRSTTVIEEDGSITAKGHARKGEYTVRTLLYKDISTPFIIREKIASLVRFPSAVSRVRLLLCYDASRYVAM